MSARLTLPLGLLATPWWSQQLQIVLDTRLFESRSSNVTQPRKTGPSAKTSSPQTTSSSKPTQHKLPSFSSFFFFCLCDWPFRFWKVCYWFCAQCAVKESGHFCCVRRNPNTQTIDISHSFLSSPLSFHPLPSIYSLPSTPFLPFHFRIVNSVWWWWWWSKFVFCCGVHQPGCSVGALAV